MKKIRLKAVKYQSSPLKYNLFGSLRKMTNRLYISVLLEMPSIKITQIISMSQLNFRCMVGIHPKIYKASPAKCYISL